MAALDLEAHHGAAMAVRRQAVELAGAAVGAIAVDELTSLIVQFVSTISASRCRLLMVAKSIVAGVST